MFSKPPKPNPPAPEPPEPAKKSWTVTRQVDVARFFGQSLDTVKGWAKQGMPGHANAYDLQAVVAWLRKEGPWRERTQRGNGTPDEETILLSGPSTASLERLRAAKAAIAELDLQLRRGQLVTVERAKDVGLRWAVIIKRMAERLGKRYGQDATAAVNETLEECARVLETGFAPPANPDSDAQLVARKRKAKKRKAHKPVGRKRSHRPQRSTRR